MSCQVLISLEIHEQISCWSPGMWSISRHQFWWIWSWCGGIQCNAKHGLLNQGLRYDWKSLYNVCHMDASNLSNFEQILITRYVLNLYHRIAFVEQWYCHCKTKCNRNKQTYEKHKKVGVRLLKLTSEFGCASDPVYLALFHYIDGKFRHSLNILEETKPKLYQDYIFYWNE